MNEGLSTVGLDELVELRPEKVATNKDPNLPYIGLEHIAQGQPHLLGSLPSSASVSINCYFSKDDILFGKLRPNLRKSLKAPFAGYCSTDIIVLRARDGVLPSYAAHVFQWERVFAAASATAVGTKMPRTSWNELRRYRVFKTDSDIEQSSIAAVLDTVDEAIAKTEAVIAKLRQVRAGLLHDLLTRGLDRHGQLRDPIAYPEQFRDSPLGRIPREWRPMKFADACTKVGVGIATSTTSHFVTKGVPMLRNQNITERGISLDDLVHISEAFAEVNRTKSLERGDIVTVRTGYPGLSAVVTEREEGWQTFTTLISRPRFDLFDSEFLVLQLNSVMCKRQIACLQAGGAQQNLNSQVLETLDVLWMPKPEQEQVRAHVNASEGDLRSEESVLAKQVLLKSGLMADLLTGRVRVKVGGAA